MNGTLIHVAVEAPDADFDAFWDVAKPLVDSIRFE